MNEIKQLAKNECACYIGQGCVYGGPCRYFREDGETAQCAYFEQYVLPADPSLEAEYWRTRKEGDAEDAPVSGERKLCKQCGKPFVRQAKNQVYCPGCAERRKQDSRRKASREWRERQKRVRDKS